MPTFTFRSTGHLGLIPTDEDGLAYCRKRVGQNVQVKVSQPRSMDQNALLWQLATMVHEQLPEKWADHWPDKYRMVKGLQLALGLVDETAVPTKDGVDIVRTPSSIADMDHDEANKACDLLFRGMARLLGISVEALLNEHARRAA